MHAQLTRYREVEPNVVEQRACRTRKVMPIGGEPAKRALAGGQKGLPVLPHGRVPIVLHERGKLALQRPTELIHMWNLLPMRSAAGHPSHAAPRQCVTAVLIPGERLLSRCQPAAPTAESGPAPLPTPQSACG